MNRGKFALLSLSACLLATVAEAQEPETKQADKQQVEEQQIEQLQHETAALEKEVDRLKRFKISGYIQAQYQHGQEDASLDVGEESNEADRGGFNRMGIRRGRLKLAYEGAVTSGVFQIDITEKGVQVKDAYFNLQDPWIRTLGFRAGIFWPCASHPLVSPAWAESLTKPTTLRGREEFSPSPGGCRFVKHLVQREIQRKQQVFLSERARQEGA